MLFSGLFMLSISANVFSQDKQDSVSIIKPVNPYILKFDTLLSISYNVNSEFDFFEVKGDDFIYDIRPNISYSNKISISYRFIKLNMAFKPKFFPGNNDDDIQGKTKSFGIGINYLSDHWLQELQYVHLKGFYLHNTGDFNNKWIQGTDPYIQFPDLRVNFYRGSTGYKFNPNLSLNAISSQTEKQLKSCGSFIPFLVYDYFIIDNKSNDPVQTSSQKSNNFALTASAGYIYTLVIHSDFYASLGFFPGVGFQNTKLLTRLPEGNYTTKHFDPLFRLTERAGIGYNTNKFFTGAEVSFSQATHPQDKSRINTKSTRAFFQVFAGYRFNAPKFLKREVDSIKNFAEKPLKKKNKKQ